MPLATSADVETRLRRELTEAEEESAEQTIETVTGLVADVVDQKVEWVEALDPVSPVLRALCVERAITALANPTGIASESETLGTHSYSQTHRSVSEGGGLELTGAEERLVRRAVYSPKSASSTPGSTIDRLINVREGRDPDQDAA